MSYVTSALRALAITLKNATRAPTTVEFPIVIRPRAERYRASFALLDDEHGELSCVGCLACERICPSQVIKIKTAPKRESPVTGKKRAYADGFTLDLGACIGCELCVQVCNTDSIAMVREPEVPTFSRGELILDLEKLRANAREKAVSWGRGTLLQEMQK
jgi:NADH-quinone oxidoreductase subunit I